MLVHISLRRFAAWRSAIYLAWSSSIHGTIILRLVLILIALFLVFSSSSDPRKLLTAKTLRFFLGRAIAKSEVIRFVKFAADRQFNCPIRDERFQGNAVIVWGVFLGR